MENNFTNHDFEEFLQGQLKNHRMYPADTVWRNIHKKLHGDTKWPALTIGALAMLSAIAFIFLHFAPKPNLFAVKSTLTTNEVQSSVVPNGIIGNITTNKYLKGAAFTVQPYIHQSAEPISNNDQQNIAGGAGEIKLPVKGLPDKDIAAGTYKTPQPSTSESLEDLPSSSGFNKELLMTEIIAPPIAFNLYDNTIQPTNDNKVLAATPPKVQGSLIQQFKASHARKSKLQLQLYVAPSISYRDLYEEPTEPKTTQDGPVALNYVADVNTVVRHKPGTGIEAGLAFLYGFTKVFRAKAGVQFNVRQYSIEAYKSGAEVASIALVDGARLDTVSRLAMYRNSNGYSSTDLVNRYYQVSIPLGLELEILGNKKFQWNVAASIQPTYLLNRNAYMISTNFKNYTESPDMVRRWNLNSNMETFISFRSGDFKWQVGPQVRYQPYSTFISQYPIKEHLLDYGVKVGLSTGF